MKVLFVTNVPSPYRVDFFNELGTHCDLTVFYERRADSNRDRKWKGTGAITYKEKYSASKPIGHNRSLGCDLIREIKKCGYDVIIITGYASPSIVLAIMYCRGKKIPYYIESDGGFCKKDTPLKYLLKRYLFRGAKGFFVSCNEYRNYLLSFKIDPQKIFIYPFTSVRKKNILEHPLSLREKRDLRKQLGLSDGVILIAVGQFIYRKGFDILLKALPLIKYPIQAFIVGGNITEEYADLCEKMNLKNVRFVPFLEKEQLFRLYKAADIFVLPTREDIWGLVINEAMACGLPVVSTDKCIAALELIQNGFNGFVVESNNVSALAEAINETLSGDLTKMGEESINQMRGYSIEKMAQRHLEVLEKEKQEKS